MRLPWKQPGAGEEEPLVFDEPYSKFAAYQADDVTAATDKTSPGSRENSNHGSTYGSQEQAPVVVRRKAPSIIVNNSIKSDVAPPKTQLMDEPTGVGSDFDLHRFLKTVGSMGNPPPLPNRPAHTQSHRSSTNGALPSAGSRKLRKVSSSVTSLPRSTNGAQSANGGYSTSGVLSPGGAQNAGDSPQGTKGWLSGLWEKMKSPTKSAPGNAPQPSGDGSGTVSSNGSRRNSNRLTLNLSGSGVDLNLPSRRSVEFGGEGRTGSCLKPAMAPIWAEPPRAPEEGCIDWSVASPPPQPSDGSNIIVMNRTSSSLHSPGQVRNMANLTSKGAVPSNENSSSPTAASKARRSQSGLFSGK